ncbi:MAG: bifunctional (p)ppGpp synthetase/guanosine-3',5'-bis(diphosphate) 3'-pyrophosphohydrolase [Lachnospiraceae bacterium]|nr:bifunctional (p)ppGpp synthetase/guanosine-3',5'-bis(diphosphate) 3'-pyrophosphohydrolase [Lachnospiraceae bacterium]
MKELTVTVRKQVEEGNALHQAILMAARAHKGQIRKGTQLDYIIHPMEVLEILASMKADINLRIAGVLHDTLEDTDLSMEQIQETFGDDVAELVSGHTEDKSKSWKERKRWHIERLQTGSKRHRMMVLADSLSNLRSMVIDYAAEGEKFWQRFHAPKTEQAWYYHGMRKAMISLREDPDTIAAYQEMESLCCKIFGEQENECL